MKNLLRPQKIFEQLRNRENKGKNKRNWRIMIMINMQLPAPSQDRLKFTGGVIADPIT
jgi:hypothetical protein